MQRSASKQLSPRIVCSTRPGSSRKAAIGRMIHATKTSEIEMPSENGLIQLRSHHTGTETLQRLQSILGEKGMQVFALIDHSGEAEKAGLKMPSTKVLIFGNPKGGTPLMLAAPSLAID